MDYRNEKHKIAFEDAVRKADIRNYTLLSVLYLLTADRKLWISSKPHISKNEIAFEKIELKNSDEKAYALFCTAKDLYLKTKHMAITDLADTDLISPKIFTLICNAMSIRRSGLNAEKLNKEMQHYEQN